MDVLDDFVTGDARRKRRLVFPTPIPTRSASFSLSFRSTNADDVRGLGLLAGRGTSMPMDTVCGFHKNNLSSGLTSPGASSHEISGSGRLIVRISLSSEPRYLSKGTWHPCIITYQLCTVWGLLTSPGKDVVRTPKRIGRFEGWQSVFCRYILVWSVKYDMLACCTGIFAI